MKSNFRSQLQFQLPTVKDGQAASRALLFAFEHFFKKAWPKKGAAYRPLPSEVALDLSELNATQWSFPKLQADTIRFLVPGAQGFEESELKFSEPIAEGASEMDLQDVGVMLIPGQAFSIQGDRLGRGGGYYDRALQNFKGLKIGVCQQDRVFNEIPTETHDVKVHALVTPVGNMYFSGGIMWRQ